MNTATYRAIARKAESVQDWARAATFYGLAVSHYPPFNPSPQSLAYKDCANLRQLMEECQRMASQVQS
jgi:hypothetical protein